MFKLSAASQSAGGNDESMKVHEVECNVLDRLKVVYNVVKNFSVFNKPYSYIFFPFQCSPNQYRVVIPKCKLKYSPEGSLPCDMTLCQRVLPPDISIIRQ